MKKLLILLLFIPLGCFGQSYVSPIGFNNNEDNKNKVIEYIKYEVKRTYSAIGMDNPSILRMMEDENLDAFKELLKVKNESILKRVEKTYCDIGMCNYIIILTMYKEESIAENKSLEW